MHRHAYAAVCLPDDLAKSDVALSAAEYARLRAELAALFFIARPDFTIADLVSTPYSRGEPAEENVYAGGHAPD